VPDDLIYEEGVETDVCTLILNGKVTVLAGADRFRADVSSWSVLGVAALTTPSYKPDFTAFVSSGPCRCLRFTKARFDEAVDASAVERTAHSNPPIVISDHDVPSTGPASAAVSDIEQSDHQRRRDEAVSRRSKFIAALQRKSKFLVGSDRELDGDDGKEEEEAERAPKGVGYAAEGGLNAVLTEGGMYQPRQDSSTRALPPSPASKSTIEFLG
jgi:hypothetical protein